MAYKTEQEAFWAGSFGTDYIERNNGNELFVDNRVFFSKALASAHSLSSCIEFGASIGMNLRALRLLWPEQEQHVIEINAHGAAELRKVISHANLHEQSILDFAPARTWDLGLTKGVLIHTSPNWLLQAYDALHRAAGHYLLVCEYCNPSPMEIGYRGHSGRLFKRDFCGEVLDRFADLKPADYGFAYHRDPDFPQDDIT